MERPRRAAASLGCAGDLRIMGPRTVFNAVKRSPERKGIRFGIKAYYNGRYVGDHAVYIKRTGAKSAFIMDQNNDQTFCSTVMNEFARNGWNMSYKMYSGDRTPFLRSYGCNAFANMLERINY